MAIIVIVYYIMDQSVLLDFFFAAMVMKCFTAEFCPGFASCFSIFFSGWICGAADFLFQQFY